ncbi:MAG: DUF3445 domain-containing protein, partial [Actinobacteria bacterium]|nr:DUF3445 domain-containing protein [Actinomycetota bacterium]
VCSPSRWRLAEKIGLDMLAVHKPVALYAEHIGAAVDTTLTRLSPDKPIWRSNWTLEDHPALFQPYSPDGPMVEEPSELWIRIERETLRRLPRTRGILFTIRGFQEPLSSYFPTHLRATRACTTTETSCSVGSTLYLLPSVELAPERVTRRIGRR